MCPADKGGTGCFLVSLPEDHGIQVDSRLMLNALVNDVRAANAPLMRFYLEAAIKITTRPLRHSVGLWYVGQTADYTKGLLRLVMLVENCTPRLG